MILKNYQKGAPRQNFKVNYTLFKIIKVENRDLVVAAQQAEKKMAFYNHTCLQQKR